MATRLLYANTSYGGGGAGSIVNDLKLNSFNFTFMPMCSASLDPSYHEYQPVTALADDGSGNLYMDLGTLGMMGYKLIS